MTRYKLCEEDGFIYNGIISVQLLQSLSLFTYLFIFFVVFLCSLELLSVILTSGIKKLNLKREMKWIVVVVVKVCRHENGLLESFDSCTLYYRSAIKVLLYTRQLIYFLATCLASLSRHKLHKIIVAWWNMPWN